MTARVLAASSAQTSGDVALSMRNPAAAAAAGGGPTMRRFSPYEVRFSRCFEGNVLEADLWYCLHSLCCTRCWDSMFLGLVICQYTSIWVSYWAPSRTTEEPSYPSRRGTLSLSHRIPDRASATRSSPAILPACFP